MLLVVEDEPLVARSRRLSRTRATARVLGPIPAADAAWRLARAARPASALVDVVLAGRRAVAA